MVVFIYWMVVYTCTYVCVGGTLHVFTSACITSKHGFGVDSFHIIVIDCAC